MASSGGEYYQILFADSQESDDSYFLIQRQFESYDGDYFYIESHEHRLCGHFKIIKAELGRNLFCLELACTPAETVQITFQAASARYNQLRRVLKIMIPPRILKLDDSVTND